MTDKEIREQAVGSLSNMLQTVLPIGPNQADIAVAEIVTLKGDGWRLAIVQDGAALPHIYDRNRAPDGIQRDMQNAGWVREIR